jgi:hypothetical protein
MPMDPLLQVSRTYRNPELFVHDTTVKRPHANQWPRRVPKVRPVLVWRDDTINVLITEELCKSEVACPYNNVYSLCTCRCLELLLATPSTNLKSMSVTNVRRIPEPAIRCPPSSLRSAQQHASRLGAVIVALRCFSRWMCKCCPRVCDSHCTHSRRKR